MKGVLDFRFGGWSAGCPLGCGRSLQQDRPVPRSLLQKPDRLDPPGPYSEIREMTDIRAPKGAIAALETPLASRFDSRRQDRDPAAGACTGSRAVLALAFNSATCASRAFLLHIAISCACTSLSARYSASHRSRSLSSSSNSRYFPVFRFQKRSLPSVKCFCEAAGVYVCVMLPRTTGLSAPVAEGRFAGRRWNVS